ncbi:MAG: RluA family pseudouridine synthase [Planctomycetales bacterium]|nr:RluA family pseudouridine synthase [Planctomycetales bacterium]
MVWPRGEELARRDAVALFGWWSFPDGPPDRLYANAGFVGRAHGDGQSSQVYLGLSPLSLILRMTVLPPTHRFTAESDLPIPLVTALREWLPDQSWSQIRKLIRSRRVAVGSALCLDESRKVAAGDVVCVHAEPLPPPPTDDDVTILFRDRDLVIVEKPARMVTLRHRAERHWTRDRKDRQPTLDEVLERKLGLSKRRPGQPRRPPLFSVHRIDRDTSGLLIFARSEPVQSALIAQFAERAVARVYRTIILGTLPAQTFRSRLVRDRGDGLRGSTDRDDIGYEAVTHVSPLRSLGADYSELQCRLETGRTHQIRIHLAESGHPVCGDAVYRGPCGEPPIADQSGAPRLALHAAELGIVHPVTNEPLHFTTDWPVEMQKYIRRLTSDNNKSRPAGGGKRLPRGRKS